MPMAASSKNRLLKLGGVALILWLIFRKKSISDFVSFTIDNITFSGDLLNPKADVILGVINHTLLPVTVTSITGNFYLNSESIKIGEVGKFTPIDVQASFNGQPVKTLVTIPINIIFSGVVNTIQSLLSSTATGTKFIFIGSAVCNSLTFPINITFQN
jgi:hypothetical protein